MQTKAKEQWNGLTIYSGSNPITNREEDTKTELGNLTGQGPHKRQINIRHIIEHTVLSLLYVRAMAMHAHVA